MQKIAFTLTVFMLMQAQHGVYDNFLHLNCFFRPDYEKTQNNCDSSSQLYLVVTCISL